MNLVLAALYESLGNPLVIMLSVPTALLGAVGALFLRSIVSDVYAQVGYVMLIGLSAKNAILIVEFAIQERAAGKTRSEAVIAAAQIRLRPILMTSIAFIAGFLPLVFASGAGAASRHSLGTAVVGGMRVSTALNLIVVPAMYIIIDGIGARLRRIGDRRRSRVRRRSPVRKHDAWQSERRCKDSAEPVATVASLSIPAGCDRILPSFSVLERHATLSLLGRRAEVWVISRLTALN